MAALWLRLDACSYPRSGINQSEIEYLPCKREDVVGESSVWKPRYFQANRLLVHRACGVGAHVIERHLADSFNISVQFPRKTPN